MNKLFFTPASGPSVEIGRRPPFLLTGVEGTGGFQNAIVTEANAQFDGSSFAGSSVQARNIVLRLLVARDQEENRHLLQRAFSPRGEGTLVCHSGSTTRQIGCRVESLDFPHTTAAKKTAVVSLLCPNPFFRDTVEFSQNMAGKTPLLALPFALPPGGAVFSRRVFERQAALFNSGDKETGVVVEFAATGPVSNPRIDNLTTGGFLRVVTDLAAGDRLVVNTNPGSKSILLNGENLNHKLDRRSDFFSMVPGENLLQYASDDGYENLEVYPRWRAEFLGV